MNLAFYFIIGFPIHFLVKLELQEGMYVCIEPCFSKDMVLESENPKMQAQILPYSNKKVGKNLVLEFHTVKKLLQRIIALKVNYNETFFHL